MFLRHYESMLSVQSCRYLRNIWPWRQDDICDEEWVFYWNATAGGCVKTASGVTRMTPENFYILPAKMRYSTFAEQPFEHFHIHFRLHERCKTPPNIIVLPADQETLAKIRGFMAVAGKPGMLLRETVCGYSILSDCLLKLPEDILNISNRFDTRIEEVCALICANPQHNYSNDELAAHIGMARNSFLTLFRQNTGVTPARYGRHKRIVHACELLHTGDLSIDDVAEACGFVNRYHFSRIFRSITGVSPGKFRTLGRVWCQENPAKDFIAEILKIQGAETLLMP